MNSLQSMFHEVPTSPAPQELVFHCPQGIHPDIAPIWALGRWRKQACSCVTQERQEREQAEKQGEVEKAFVELCYSWLGIDYSKLSLKTFETFRRCENPQAFELAQQFVRDFKKGDRLNALFYGANTGIGKTHLATAILNALRKQGISGRFAVASELLNAIQKREDGIKFQDIASQTPVLVLDDLAQLGDTQGRESIFTLIMNARYNNSLPTIVTMNHLEKLQKHIGEAAASRLTAGLRHVKMTGEDQRRLEGKRDE